MSQVWAQMSDDKAEVFDDDEDFIVGRRWDPLGEENDKIETSNDVSKSDGEWVTNDSKEKCRDTQLTFDFLI